MWRAGAQRYCRSECGLWQPLAGQRSASVRLSTVGKVLITDHITTSPYLPLIHTNSLPGSKLARSTRVRDRCTLYARQPLPAAPGARAVPARGGARRRRASRPRAGALRRRQPRAHRPPAQRWAPAVSGSRGIGQRATASRGALAAPRTAAAGGSPRRPRGTHEGARRAVHRGRPARLRPTTPRRCGSCAAALVTRRRSPFRWSAHAPAATACKRPRARSVVRTPERHSERAMGAALTRPTGITSAPAGARACGV